MCVCVTIIEIHCCTWTASNNANFGCTPLMPIIWHFIYTFFFWKLLLLSSYYLIISRRMSPEGYSVCMPSCSLAPASVGVGPRLCLASARPCCGQQRVADVMFEASRMSVANRSNSGKTEVLRGSVVWLVVVVHNENRHLSPDCPSGCANWLTFHRPWPLLQGMINLLFPALCLLLLFHSHVWFVNNNYYKLST